MSTDKILLLGVAYFFLLGYFVKFSALCYFDMQCGHWLLEPQFATKLLRREVQNFRILRLDKTSGQTNQTQLQMILSVTYKTATFCITFERSPHFSML